MDLLKKNEFDLGKFYIAMDAKDDNGINWTTFYSEKLVLAQDRIRTLELKLIEWDLADDAEKEEIVRESLFADDQLILKEIDKDKDTIKELSKIIYKVNQMSMNDELDPQFFLESNLLTELMEEVGVLNGYVSDKRKLILGTDYDMVNEISCYATDIEKDLAYEYNIKTECIKNKKLMEDRHAWYMKTFNVSKKERDTIVEKFGNTENNSCFSTKKELY